MHFINLQFLAIGISKLFTGAFQSGGCYPTRYEEKIVYQH